MRTERILATGLLALVSACWGCAPAESSCQAAADMVTDCTGVLTEAPAECGAEAAAAAEEVLMGGCEGLADPGKADEGGLLCSEWLRWLGLCKLSTGSGNRTYIERLASFGPAPGVYSGVGRSGQTCTARIDYVLGSSGHYTAEVTTAGGAPSRFHLGTGSSVNVRDWVQPTNVAMVTIVIQDTSLNKSYRPRLSLERLADGKFTARVSPVNEGGRANPQNDPYCTFAP